MYLDYDHVLSSRDKMKQRTCNTRSVSSGLNEVRGAHDDEQQSAWPGARREARAAGCASREGARRNVRPDAPNNN